MVGEVRLAVVFEDDLRFAAGFEVEATSCEASGIASDSTTVG